MTPASHTTARRMRSRPLFRSSAQPRNQGENQWSGRRESNPHNQFGRLRLSTCHRRRNCWPTGTSTQDPQWARAMHVLCAFRKVAVRRQFEQCPAILKPRARSAERSDPLRFGKNTLGWAAPALRTPEQADRWTWLIVAAYTKLRLSRGIVADERLPWQRPRAPDKLTPARVRRGFRRLRAHPCPAVASGARPHELRLSFSTGGRSERHTVRPRSNRRTDLC